MVFFSSKNEQNDRVNLALTCLLLGIVAATFFSRIWDPDFFWHLANGRWIVQNMTLPDRDPFTPFSAGTAAEALILKCYWLTQVTYHFVYTLCGTFGLALLKSATFVALFALILHYHDIQKSSLPWVLFALLPLYEVLLNFRADRPNMLSLFFFAVLLYLLESQRWKLLPLLMLVWANAHGGFVVGDVVILLYLAALALGKKEELSPRVIGWGLLAVGASIINPLGITPFIIIFKFDGGSAQQKIVEFMSPLQVFLEYHDYYLGYALDLLLAAGALAFFRKSAFWPKLAILLFTGFISLQHIRFMPFFVISCAFFLPVLFNRFTLPVMLKRSMLYGSMALIILLFTSDLLNGRALSMGLERGRFPEKAAEFIEKSGVAGRVFCDDAWGGYLLWRLPDSVVLYDTRGLSGEMYRKYSKIMNTEPGWEEELLALDTKIIVSAAFNPVSGTANRLWQALAYSQNWQIAYADDNSLVFFRKDVGLASQEISQSEKRAISLKHALAQIQTIVAKYPQTPWHWGDLAHIHVLRGETKEAVQAYRQALELDPGNNDYQGRLNILEASLSR